MSLIARCEQWLKIDRFQKPEPKLKDVPKVGDPFLTSLPSGDCFYCGEHILGGEGCWYSVVDSYEVCSSGKSPTSFHEVRERKVENA